VAEAAKGIGLDDVEDGGINELLESHGIELSADDSEELAEQLSREDT
jgi:hypothetical protein